MKAVDAAGEIDTAVSETDRSETETKYARDRERLITNATDPILRLPQLSRSIAARAFSAKIRFQSVDYHGNVLHPASPEEAQSTPFRSSWVRN